MEFPSFIEELPLTRAALEFAAAVLHDVIEDAGVGRQELEQRFGARVAELVSAVSEPQPGGSYRERKARLREAVAQADADAAAIFAADKVAKLRELRPAMATMPDYAPDQEKLASAFGEQLGSQLLEPARRPAEARDPVELVLEPVRSPRDRQELDRGRQHQRVVVEQLAHPLHVAADPQVSRLRQAPRQLDETARQAAGAGSQLGERASLPDIAEQLLDLVLNDQRFGRDPPQQRKLLGRRPVPVGEEHGAYVVERIENLIAPAPEHSGTNPTPAVATYGAAEMASTRSPTFSSSRLVAMSA